MIRFKANIQVSMHNLWMHHVLLPEDVLQEVASKKIKRIICQINDFESFSAGIMGGKTVGYIVINKSRLKKFGLQQGDVVEVTIKEDTSEYGMEMPREFQEMLNQDPDFCKLFKALTKGKQRTLIYQVLSVKNTQKRIDKTFVIAEHLKRLNGKVEYKILNEDYKAFNRK